MSIQWVPSHVGVMGNERADRQAAKGACISLQQVTVHKAVTDIWADLGLEEMPDEYSDSDVSRGSRNSDDEALGGENEVDVAVKRPRLWQQGRVRGREDT